MLITFIIDTSPSMGTKCEDSKTMTRLDLAKMTCESMTKILSKRVQDHNIRVSIDSTTSTAAAHKQLQNLGFGYFAHDQFLLLATGRQHLKNERAIESCGVGGRLLVGCRNPSNITSDGQQSESQSNPDGGSLYPQYKENHESFERELKQLEVTKWKSSSQNPFPEDGGGARGLNIALSAGLQMLSRYRLHHRCTDNFGMGRLPSNAVPSLYTTANNNFSSAAGGSNIQPACLILLTDGECLQKPSTEGGGSLQLQVSSPLREFYREPFRWDQRIFCLGVGRSTSYDDFRKNVKPLHPSLRALSEVTGGQHMYVRSVSEIAQISERLLNLIAPQLPIQFPLPNPLRLGGDTSQSIPQNKVVNCIDGKSKNGGGEGRYVNGGPVCCFQQLEGAMGGGVQIMPKIHRAMLMYSPHSIDAINGKSMFNSSTNTYNQPIWVIPEAYFPSKKLDTLPPRSAQPQLYFSRHFQMIGSFNFNPSILMKSLNRLDQLIVCNRQLLHLNSPGNMNKNSSSRLLQRDVYVCEWQSQSEMMNEDKKGCSSSTAEKPHSQRGQEHFPVFVRGGGRNSLHEGGENVLNIGILHIPATNKDSTNQVSTLTLLPPDPHILIPLLVKLAEIEHRGLKKVSEKFQHQKTPEAMNAMNLARNNVLVDEQWRSDFCAYLFRIPPYYQMSMRRALRPLLPSNLHSLLSMDSVEVIKSQCLSRQSLSKIVLGEQNAKVNSDMLERQEEEYKRYISEKGRPSTSGATAIGYGHYDQHKMDVTTYLASLRTMPRPSSTRQKVREDAAQKVTNTGKAGSTACHIERERIDPSRFDSVGNLPSQCLLAFYESRRRWLFGGSGLTVRGLSVEGVKNDGSNVHHVDEDHDGSDDSLLSIAGVGASMLNTTPISKMGDFRERLAWSTHSIAGYGCNDSNGSVMTTQADGCPVWSVDDDALPLTFFDYKTGEFIDSAQTRLRARLAINFGNPYKDMKRGDSLIPQNYVKQRPPLQKRVKDDQTSSDPLTPPGSPPHETYSSSVEGEGEAVFAGRKQQSSTKKDKHNKDETGVKSSPQPQTSVKKRKASNDQSSKGSTLKNPSVKRSKINKGTKAPHTPPPPPLALKEQKKHPKNIDKKGPAKNKLQSQSRPPPPPPRPPQKTSQHTLNSIQSSSPHSRTTVSKDIQHERSLQRTPKQKRPPPPPQLQQPKQIQRQNQPPAPQKAQDLQTPNEKPKVVLPAGWISVWSKSKGRWYFFDTKTNKSVWEWPPPGGH